MSDKQLKLYVKLGDEFRELSGVLHSEQLKPVAVMLVGDAIDFYRSNYSKKKSPRSQKNENKYFERLMDFCIRTKIESVHQIDKVHILKFADELAQSVSNATINRHFNTLKNFFNVLVEHEYLFKSPAEHFKHKKIVKPKIHLWTDDDYARARLGLCLEDALVLDFIRETGCRSSEITGLKWTDIDFDNEVLTFQSGKHANLRRDFPLTKGIGRILHQIKMSGLFVFTRQGTKYTTDSIYKRIKKSIKANCKQKNLDVKGLRHSFATNLVKANKQPQVIKELMGHADFRTTQNYLHIDINFLKLQIK